jgi:hypothetical protein
MTRQMTDIVDAINTIRSPKKKSDPRQLFAGLLMVLFFVMLLLALIAGATVYQRVATIQMTTSNDRLGLQLIGNYVRANDSSDAIKVGTGPEGRSLVMLEKLETGNYETRIYLYNNSIVEEYAVEGAGYTPGKALKLVDSSTFSFSYANDLLTISTDQGSAKIALRSEQGGA